MKLNQRTLTAASLVLLAILLVAVNAFSNGAFRRVSLDFTADRLFTLSDGTKRILDRIDEPITLRFFFSERLGETIPNFATYATRVRELLERYASLSSGRLKVEFYSPLPFTDIEDLAVGAGLQGIPVSQAGEQVYFGLAGTNSTDDEEVIAFFQPERERFLELDLTRLIAKLVDPTKKTIGLLSFLRMDPGPRLPMARQRAGTRWYILDQMRERFDVRTIKIDVTRIDDDLDVLMVVHPKGLSDATLYAIDQYVLGGGRVLVFVDPHSEADAGSPSIAVMLGMTASDFSTLLGPWGIEMDKDKIVGDRTAAVRVRVGAGMRSRVVEYTAWMLMDKTHINRDDATTSELKEIMMATAGVLRKKAGATTKITPLIFSSREAMRIDSSKVRPAPNFTALLADYKAEGQIFVLAARIEGKVKSAFPKGPPGKKTGKTGKGKKTEAPKHLSESKGPINVIVVADTDMMQNQFWANVQDFYGQKVIVPTTDNAGFVLNALDNLSGSNALVSLRGHAVATRDFALVRRLRSDAELLYRAKERELQTKLKATEKKLKDLQTKERTAGKAIMTKQQIAAVESFRGEMLRIRKQLRHVRLALRQDIDRLGAALKFFNIGFVPLLIAAFALVFGLLRRRRQRRTAQA